MCGDEQTGRRIVLSGRGDRSATIRPVVITSVQRIAPSAWPPGWEDAEIVDSILVEEPPEPGPPGPAGGAYTRFGRFPDGPRYGRLVSVLA
jgi:hypothetical protein